MFKRILSHEIRSIFRDRMYLFLCLYPIIISIVAFFLIPYLRETASTLIGNIVTLVFVLLSSFMFGAITGFTMLDDKDDNVLLSLKVTPINLKYYILLRLLINYIFGIIATLLIIITSGFISEVSLIDLVFVLILAPIQGPLLALFINSIASNKIEGFVMMKFSGIILLLPTSALFLTNWVEIFLGILPGFWTARIISISLIPADYFFNYSYIYFVFGIIVNLFTGFLLYKKYLRKENI